MVPVKYCVRPDCSKSDGQEVATRVAVAALLRFILSRWRYLELEVAGGGNSLLLHVRQLELEVPRTMVRDNTRKERLYTICSIIPVFRRSFEYL